MEKPDFNINLMRAVLWQYENAPKFKAMIQKQQDWLYENHTKFWQDWQKDVFNLRTANDFGLAVWARILDVPLTIRRERLVQSVFGFGDETVTGNVNFGRGGFGRAKTNDYAVTTEQARKILLLRWFQITNRPTISNINQSLAIVFGAGAAYVQDNLDMSASIYMFTARPDYQTIDLLKNADLLPRPATVGALVAIQPRPGFGFGIHHLNFSNGNFSHREII